MPGRLRGAPTRFEVRFDEPLPPFDEFDREASLKLWDPRRVCKGLFLSRLAEDLGPEWPRVAATLRAPPRLGKYLPFSDYPQIDLACLQLASARHVLPDQPFPEAIRQLSRRNLKVFSESALGRVILSMVGDASQALGKLPEVFLTVYPGGSVRLVPDASGGLLEFRDVQGWIECNTVGTLEGVLSFYGKKPSLEVELLGERSANLRVRL